MPKISRLHAFAIANAYLLSVDDTVFVPAEVRSMDEWDSVEPRVYGRSFDNQWIVLLRRASGEIRIESSMAVCVDMSTGEITYYGSLNDEG